MISYFKHRGKIIFDDIHYYDTSCYAQDELWREIPEFPGFSVSDLGNVRHDASEFFLSRKFISGKHYYRIRGKLVYERDLVDQVFGFCYVTTINNSSDTTINNRGNSPINNISNTTINNDSDTVDFISSYPIVEIDKKNKFINWYSSIDSFISHFPNDGMDRQTLFQMCSNPWQFNQVYGRRLRWDPLVELKYQIVNRDL